MPDTNGYRAPFEKLVDVVQEQTQLMTRLVSLQEDLGGKMADALRALGEHSEMLSTCARDLAESHRRTDQAVEKVNTHVDLRLQESEKFWRRLATIAVIGLCVIELSQSPWIRLLSLPK